MHISHPGTLFFSFLSEPKHEKQPETQDTGIYLYIKKYFRQISIKIINLILLFIHIEVHNLCDLQSRHCQLWQRFITVCIVLKLDF